MLPSPERDARQRRDGQRSDAIRRGGLRWAVHVGTLALALGLAGTEAAAIAEPPGLTTSYGYAVFGGLKYPADFEHLDYVNPGAPKGGTYHYARQGTYDSLNFFSLLGIAPWGLLQIYDQLMERSLDEPASFYGLIAETIRYPDDYAWVEFRLRPQARWHDGQAITPEDVMFTVEMFKGLVPPIYRRIGTAVERAEKTGPRSVRLHLAQKGNPALPAMVAEMPVLPKHFYADRDFGATTLARPLGSGPYRVGAFTAGRWIEFERVKDYWARELPIKRGRCNFDVIRHDFYRDALVANEAFLAGRVDLRFEGSANRWEYEKELPPFRNGNIRRNLIRYDNGAFYAGMFMNARRPFLKDRRVRKALSLAYDFEWVQRVLLQGHHSRLDSFFANTEFAASGRPGDGEIRLLLPHRDALPSRLFTSEVPLPVGGTRERQRNHLLDAAALLRDAGYRIEHGRLVDPADGRPVTLTLIAYSPLMDRQTALFRSQLRQLGIELVFRSYDSAQFRQLLRHYDYDLLVTLPAFPPSITPGYELAQFWSSEAARTPNSRNYAGVADPVVDDLLHTIANAAQREDVVDAMRALDRVLMWNYYAIPFQHTYPAPLGEIPITYWDKFGRPEREPTYRFPFLSLDHWWLDRDKLAKLTHGRNG